MPFYFVFLIIFYVGALITGPLGFGSISEDRKIYYAPPLVFQNFNFGQKETLADIFWLRLVQDLDLCVGGSSEMDFTLPETANAKKICNFSWGFRMFDLITDLAPRFRMPHAVGGLTLSILLDDFKGASIIFDKAVEHFPNDWPILYRAAYHYLADVPQPEKAAELALRAAQAGAPDWLQITASRLYSEAGQRELALKILYDYMESLDDESRRAKVLLRIKTLEAEK